MLAPSVPESAGPGRRRAEGSAHPGLPGKGGEEGVLIRFSAAGSVICQTAHLPGSAPDDLKLARGARSALRGGHGVLRSGRTAGVPGLSSFRFGDWSEPWQLLLLVWAPRRCVVVDFVSVRQIGGAWSHIAL